MSIEVTLSDAQLKRLAAVICDQLRVCQSAPVARPEAGSGLVTAAELGRRLGIARATVYEHAAELGAIEVGRGKRPRLRFDPQKALAAWTHREQSRESPKPSNRTPAGVPRRRKPASLGSSAGLLPVRDRLARRSQSDPARVER